MSIAADEGMPFETLNSEMQELAQRVHDIGGSVLVTGEDSFFAVFGESKVLTCVKSIDASKFGIKNLVFNASCHPADEVLDHFGDDGWMKDTAKEFISGRSADEIVTFLTRYGIPFNELYGIEEPDRNPNAWEL